MDKHIFLMFNMGNAGGQYFEDICNTHEDVQIWQEVNHFLGVDKLDSSTQLDRAYDFFMVQCRRNPKKTVGLIKTFDERLIKLAGENNGSIMQMFRHPIGIVGFKNSLKMAECKQRGLFEKLDTPDKIFEAHVEFYASRYKAYTDNSDKWPVVKLEDLKKSLREGTSYFEDIMKRALKVDWREKHTQRVIAMGGLEENTDHFEVWESWSERCKEIFFGYFEDIMKLYHYEWER